MKYAYREFQQAIALLLEVIRIAPGLPHAYHTLGLIYEETGQPLKGLKLFMMAAHLSKKDLGAWKQLAQLSRRHGEMQQCIYCLQRKNGNGQVCSRWWGHDGVEITFFRFPLKNKDRNSHVPRPSTNSQVHRF